MARSPSWRTTLRPKTISLRMVGAHAGVQSTHYGRTLCEQEQHDYQDEEQVAQEVGDPGQDSTDNRGEVAWFHSIVNIDFGEP
jgi:hypothetical protein